MTTLILLYLGVGCAVAAYTFSALGLIGDRGDTPEPPPVSPFFLAVFAVLVWPMVAWFEVTFIFAKRRARREAFREFLLEEFQRADEQRQLRLRDFKQTAGSTQMKNDSTPP